MAAPKTTSKSSTAYPKLEYLQGVMELMADHGVISLTLKDLQLHRDPTAQPKIAYTPNPKEDYGTSPDAFLAPPTSPEELEARISNLGLEYE